MSSLSVVNLGALAASMTDNADKEAAGPGAVKFLKFDSKGAGVFFYDDVEYEDGTRFAVDVSSIQHGWMAWSNSLGAAPIKESVRLIDGPRPPEPAQKDGYKGFQKSWGMGLIDPQGTPVYMEANTWGWQQQYQRFVLDILVPAAQDGSMGVPMVELANNGKRDKNGNLYPVVRFVGWAGAEELAQLEGGEGVGEKEKTVDPEPESAPRGRARRRVNAA